MWERPISIIRPAACTVRIDYGGNCGPRGWPGLNGIMPSLAAARFGSAGARQQVAVGAPGVEVAKDAPLRLDMRRADRHPLGRHHAVLDPKLSASQCTWTPAYARPGS